MEWGNIGVRSKSSTLPEWNSEQMLVEFQELALVPASSQASTLDPAMSSCGFSQLVCYCDKAFGVLFLNAVSAFKSVRVNIAVVFARSALQFRFPILAVVQNFLTHYQAAGTNRG